MVEAIHELAEFAGRRDLHRSHAFVVNESTDLGIGRANRAHLHPQQEIEKRRQQEHGEGDHRDKRHLREAQPGGRVEVAQSDEALEVAFEE